MFGDGVRLVCNRNLVLVVGACLDINMECQLRDTKSCLAIDGGGRSMKSLIACSCWETNATRQSPDAAAALSVADINTQIYMMILHAQPIEIVRHIF